MYHLKFLRIFLCVCTCGGQRITLSVIPQSRMPSASELRVSLGLEAQ